MGQNNLNPIDGMTGFVEAIDSRHALMHDGWAFYNTHLVSVGTATAAAVLITIPSAASYTYHFQFHVSTRVSASVNWVLYEDPTVTVGTAITSYCKNRQANNSTGVLIHHTPTLGTATTILTQVNHGVSAASESGGLNASGGEEWILRRDTRYVLKVTAFTASSSVAINCSWYETGH